MNTLPFHWTFEDYDDAYTLLDVYRVAKANFFGLLSVLGIAPFMVNEDNNWFYSFLFSIIIAMFGGALLDGIRESIREIQIDKLDRIVEVESE